MEKPPYEQLEKLGFKDKKEALDLIVKKAKLSMLKTAADFEADVNIIFSYYAPNDDKSKILEHIAILSKLIGTNFNNDLESNVNAILNKVLYKTDAIDNNI